MKKVFKYEFDFEDYFSVDLPKYAEILTCKKMYDKWFLWAVVEDDQPLTDKRNFRLCGTGHHLIEDNYRWITTEFEIVGGHNLVWHIFEII
jgi:hypothetical protein